MLSELGRFANCHVIQ